MPQNWKLVNGAKVNVEIADHLDARGLVIVYADDDGDAAPDPSRAVDVTREHRADAYPWVAYVAARCRECATETCPCPRPLIRERPLHHLVWEFFDGSSNPRKPAEVIHHRNANKCDARRKNLAKGSRRAHGLAHASRRQKFAPRERHDFNGWRYRPPQPAQVKFRPDMVGKPVAAVPKAPRVLSTAKRVNDVVVRLGELLPALVDELAHLDSGAPIPRSAPMSAWRAPRTRMLGLAPPRLEPLHGEAALVMLLIRERFDVDKVASATGEPAELLRLLLRRPSVDVAIRRWREHRRLPVPRDLLASARSAR